MARHGVGKVEEVEKGGKGKTAHDAILHSSLKLHDQRPIGWLFCVVAFALSCLFHLYPPSLLTQLSITSDLEMRRMLISLSPYSGDEHHSIAISAFRRGEFPSFLSRLCSEVTNVTVRTCRHKHKQYTHTRPVHSHTDRALLSPRTHAPVLVLVFISSI